MTPKKVTTIRLDESVVDGLQLVKDRDGVPISEQVRRALNAWLKSKGVELKSDRRRASTRKRP
jgi:Ribbon-helix-helix protein, copG family